MTARTEKDALGPRARAERQRRSEARGAIAALAAEIAALRGMSVADLRAAHHHLFGEPSHSRNKRYLRAKLAHRLQEIAEQGPRPPARGWMDAMLGAGPGARFGLRTGEAPRGPGREKPAASARARDPRLPAPGTVLRREYRGEVHQVTVLDDGFEYRGRRFTSLSTVAGTITGCSWSGFAFFALDKPASLTAIRKT